MSFIWARFNDQATRTARGAGLRVIGDIKLPGQCIFLSPIGGLFRSLA